MSNATTTDEVAVHGVPNSVSPSAVRPVRGHVSRWQCQGRGDGAQGAKRPALPGQLG